MPAYGLSCIFMDTIVSLKQQMAEELTKRGDRALELEAEGKTWQQIGDEFGVTRQRAGQILEAARKRRAREKRKAAR